MKTFITIIIITIIISVFIIPPLGQSQVCHSRAFMPGIKRKKECLRSTLYSWSVTNFVLCRWIGSHRVSLSLMGQYWVLILIAQGKGSLSQDAIWSIILQHMTGEVLTLVWSPRILIDEILIVWSISKIVIDSSFKVKLKR